jgi:iron complex outermembrane receptor protein
MQLHRIALAVAAAFPSRRAGPGYCPGRPAQNRSGGQRPRPAGPQFAQQHGQQDSRAVARANRLQPEDIAVNLPSTTVRKRYFGDRNANVAGRSYGTLQPGRALVYLDGYLISNFLGRFDAPRWNMVNVEAIERIDALYGPFSAIYPGNSMGTTLIVTERKPRGLEASASIKLNQQGFNEYATSENYTSKQVSGRIASRLDSGLWYAVSMQHQDSQGHPMGYANAVRGATSGAFATATAAAKSVTGIVYDRDPQVPRARPVWRHRHGPQQAGHRQPARGLRAVGHAGDRGPRGLVARRQHRHQHHLAARRGRQPGVERSGERRRPPVQRAANAFAPSTRDEAHRQLGATWKTKHAKGWNASVVATDYVIQSDAARQANLAQPLADLGGAGTVTRRDGTGWNTFEVQSTYTPSAGDFGNGRHALVLGLHRNQYTLQNVVNNAPDWRGAETTQNQNYYGKTTITALYAQDAWKLHPDWMLTTGLRFENFESA